MSYDMEDSEDYEMYIADCEHAQVEALKAAHDEYVKELYEGLPEYADYVANQLKKEKE